MKSHSIDSQLEIELSSERSSTDMSELFLPDHQDLQSAHAQSTSQAFLQDATMTDKQPCTGCRWNSVQSTANSGHWRGMFIPPTTDIAANVIAGIIAGLKIVIGMVLFANIIFNAIPCAALNGMFAFGINFNLASACICILVSTICSRMNVLSSPQDIPAVILAQMVVPIADRTRHDPDVVANTVIACVWISALVGGLFSMLLGAMGVAPIFQRIPTPVVGGFTAAVGASAVFNALGILTGTPFKIAWPENLDNFNDLLWWMHLGFGMGTLFCIRYLPGYIKPHVKNSFLASLVGPLCLLFPLAIFYVVLLLRMQIADDLKWLRDKGWVYQELTGSAPMSLWQAGRIGCHFDHIDWKVIFSGDVLMLLVVLQLLSSLSAVLGLVGADASGLLPSSGPLDINKELKVMGFQNLLVGIAGGSYGYVQMGMSINLFKDGGTHRLSHLIAFFFVLTVLLSGIPVSSYMPKFFLGGIFLNLGVGFMVMHLVEKIGKMARISYASMWIIVVISRFDLNYAVIVGLGIQVALLITFSSTIDPVYQVDTTATTASARLRTLEEREFIRKSKLIHVARLRGPLFFGVSPQLRQSLNKILADADPKPRFLILDLREVTVLDDSAMAVLRGFASEPASSDVRLFFSGAGEREVMLNRNKYHRYHANASSNGKEPACFEVLDDALEACEDLILQDASSSGAPNFVSTRVTIAESFQAMPGDQYPPLMSGRTRSTSSSDPDTPTTADGKTPTKRHVTVNADTESIAPFITALSGLPCSSWSGFLRYCTQLKLKVDDVIYEAGAPADSIFILTQGVAEVVMVTGERLHRVVALAILGTMPFFNGGAQHSDSAHVVSTGGAVVLELTRQEFQRLKETDIKTYVDFVDHLLLRQMSNPGLSLRR